MLRVPSVQNTINDAANKTLAQYNDFDNATSEKNNLKRT